LNTPQDLTFDTLDIDDPPAQQEDIYIIIMPLNLTAFSEEAELLPCFQIK